MKWWEQPPVQAPDDTARQESWRARQERESRDVPERDTNLPWLSGSKNEK